ncbi:uncharacterized protein LOC111518885 isoform X1 [Drosophila willistoni]|uniref:uncharacterized protein LOC111518885 isoform X1 n=1 Tax=Drosophila willistoni TaxID=7260 RepID=UPI001F07AB27|nr:uncharacterized protein LOC111518885 isoform X1 [Drosophila willistoni]
MDCVYGNTTISCHFGPVKQAGHNLNIEFDYRFTLYMKDPLSTTQMSFNISKEAMVILPAAQVESVTPGPNEICFDVQGDYFNDIYWDWPVVWHFNVKSESCETVNFIEKNCNPLGILYPRINTFKCCLGQLQGYRKYKINFSRKFKDSSFSHWANTTISNQTTCDIPSKPPDMKGNWFEYDGNTLRLYWVHLHEDQQNCNNVTYEITVDDKSIKADYIDQHSAYIMDWQENRSHNIKVRSKNIMGLSVNGSMVSVPKLSDESMRGQLKVVYNKSSHIATWTFNDQRLNSTDLKGFTILWCHLGIDNARCEATKRIESIEVGRTEYSYNFWPSEGPRGITVGVLANFENPAKSGGLYWDTKPPETPSKPFSIIPYLMASALSLTFASSGYYAYNKLKKRAQISVDIQQDLETPVAEWLRANCDNQSNGTLNILSSLCRVIWLKTFANLRIREAFTGNNRENEELIASVKPIAVVKNETTDALEMKANPVSDPNNQSETTPDSNSFHDHDDPPNNSSPLPVPCMLVDSNNYVDNRSGMQGLGAYHQSGLPVQHANNSSGVIVCEMNPDSNNSGDPSNNPSPAPVPGIMVTSNNYVDNRSGMLDPSANNRNGVPVRNVYPPNNQNGVPVRNVNPPNSQSGVPVRNVNPPNSQSGLVAGFSGYVDPSTLSTGRS